MVYTFSLFHRIYDTRKMGFEQIGVQIHNGSQGGYIRCTYTPLVITIEEAIAIQQRCKSSAGCPVAAVGTPLTPLCKGRDARATGLQIM